ncbi:MAG: guanylate kinase [Anaerovoracaceae bacterium]|jgi:guanylate kinase
MNRNGRLLVISGPSGTGKGTICSRLTTEMEKVRLSISMTTRKKRGGETHGESYYFVTREEFEETIERDGFLEYARVYDNYYGTPREKVLQQLQAGYDVVLEIDTQGAEKIHRSFPGGIFIFILPPSMAELRRRITGRGTDSAEVIERRLAEALSEIRCARWYDYCVVNDDLEEAVRRVEAIILAEHARVDEGIDNVIAKYEEEEL